MSTKYIVKNIFVVLLTLLDSPLSNSIDLKKWFTFVSCTDDENVGCRLKSSTTTRLREKGPKLIYAKEQQYDYYYHFGGYWENKNWKIWRQKSVKNISKYFAVRKRQ